MLEDLEQEYSWLEIERSLIITKKDIIEFVREYTDGNINDKAFQKRLVNALVNSVYVYDDRTVVYFNVGNKDKTKPSKRDTDEVLAENAIKKEQPDSSGSVPCGGTGGAIYVLGSGENRWRDIFAV